MEHFDWLKGFVFPYINFAIFLFLAIKLFRKPVADLLQGRRLHYERLMLEARAAKDAAEAKNLELSQRLDNLDIEIETKSLRARAAAEHEAEDMLNRAKRLSAQIQEEAKRMVEAEVKGARSQLQAEIMDQVKGLVTKRLLAMSSQEQSDIVKKKIAAVASNRAEH